MPDQSSPSATLDTAAPARPVNSKARGPLFLIFGGVVAVAALGFGAYTLIEGGKSVETAATPRFFSASGIQVRRIVILGGGTSGWMCAAAFSQLLRAPGYSVRLIESDEIAT